MYLTESAQKSIKESNVVAIAFPYYASKERIEKAFLGKNTPPEDVYMFIDTDEIQTFSQNQYAIAHKISVVVLTSQIQLGGSNNISLGGMFLHSNKNIKSPEIVTLSEHNPDDSPINYFSLSKNGLNRLGVNSRVLQMEMINTDNIGSVEKWQKIIEESRLIVIAEDEEGKKTIIVASQNPRR